MKTQYRALGPDKYTIIARSEESEDDKWIQTLEETGAQIQKQLVDGSWVDVEREEIRTQKGMA